MTCSVAADVRRLAIDETGLRTGAAEGSGAAGARDVPATILVVDDDERVRELVCRMLRHAGYTLLSAGSGSEAVALAEAHAGDISLLLTDMLMPEMDGPQVARMIQQTRPGLRVLMMTGAPTAGPDTLSKPFSMPTLLDAVRRALSARS
jgi:two-component system cell cycle sensor histidine kinase/response regulator CckA